MNKSKTRTFALFFSIFGFIQTVYGQEKILISSTSVEAPLLMNESHVAINKTGDRIAYSSANIISLYEYPTMEPITTWDTPSWLSGLSFSSNGQYLWTYHDYEKYQAVRTNWPRDSIRVWQLTNSQEKPKITTRFASPTGLSYSRDTTNQWMVFHGSLFRKNPTYNSEYCSGSFLGKSKEGSVVNQLRLPSCAVSEITSTDGSQFVIGHIDGLLTSWSTDDLSQNWEQQLGEHPIRIHELIQDSLILVSHGYKYRNGSAVLEIRNIRNGQSTLLMKPSEWDYTTEGEIINDVAYDKVNERLVIIYDNFNLAVIDIETKEILRSGGQIKGLQRLHDVTIDLEGKVLIAGSPRQMDGENAQLVQLDIDLEAFADSRYFENSSLIMADTSRSIYPQIQFGHIGSSNSSVDGSQIGTSRDGKFIVSKLENELIIWDASSLKLLKRFKFKGDIKAGEITQEGFIAVAETTSAPFITKYNFETGKLIELAVRNQRRILSYERIWENENGDFYLYEHNAYAFYLKTVNGKTGEITKDIHLDPKSDNSKSASYQGGRIFFIGNNELYEFNIETDSFKKLGVEAYSFEERDDHLMLVTPSGLKEYDPAQNQITRTWSGVLPANAEYYALDSEGEALIIATEDYFEYWEREGKAVKKKNQWKHSYGYHPFPLSKNRLIWSIEKEPIFSNGAVKTPPEIPSPSWARHLDLFENRIITKNAVYSLSDTDLVDIFSGNEAYFINSDSIVYIANKPESDTNYGTFHYYFIHKNLKTKASKRVILKKQPKISLNMLAYHRETGLAVTSSIFDTKIQIWDTNSGKEIGRFNEIEFAMFNQVNFSKDGSQLAISLTNTTKSEVWISSYPFKKFTKLEGENRYAVFTDTAGQLAIDRTLLDTKTGERQDTYVFSSARESAREFGSDLNRLITGYENGEIKVWNPKDPSYLFATHIHSAPIAKMVVDGCLLASLSKDGHYALQNICDEKVLVSFYPTMTGVLANHNNQFSSIWITPDNYYKATKNATNTLHFVKGNHAYSFDQFDLLYNRPDLVLTALEKSDPMLIKSYENAYYKRLEKMGLKADELAESVKTNLILPKVIINNNLRFTQTTEPEIAIPIDFIVPDGEAKQLQVVANNVPVFGSEGLPISGSEGTEIVNISLAPGINTIGFTVLGSSNMYSLKEEVTVECLVEPKLKKDLHLITIGVSDYQHVGKLKYAVTDASEISKTLAAMEGSFSNIKQYNLYNEDATRKNILQLHDSLLTSNVDDLVIVFLAGHGVVTDGLEWRYATYDFHPVKAVENGLTFKDIESLLDDIPARNRLVLVDACHSGELDAGDLRIAKSEEVKLGAVVFRSDALESAGSITKTHIGLENSFQMMGQLFNDLRSSSGAVIISAAGGAEYAWESDEWGNGVFTYAFLDGLGYSKADLNNDGKIMASELKTYIEKRVQDLTNGAQRPTSRQENLQFDFKILGE